MHKQSGRNWRSIEEEELPGLGIDDFGGYWADFAYLESNWRGDIFTLRSNHNRKSRYDYLSPDGDT